MGRSGFEPLKSKDDGFTVRCIWPLCNLPMFINWIIKKYFTPVLLWSWWSELSGQPSVYKSVALPFSLHQFFCGAGGRNRVGNRLFTSQLLYSFWFTSFCCGAGGRNWAGNRLITSWLLYSFCCTSFFCGAGGRNRTNNRLITSQMLYHWATPAFKILDFLEFWCRGAESNHRHRDFQSLALPTELPRHK